MKFALLFALAAVATADLVVAPPNPHFVYDGRFDLTDPAAPVFGWSDSGFRLAFRNSTFVKVAIKDQQSPACWYHVWIDGVSVYSGINGKAKMKFDSSQFDRTKDVHMIRVAKRSEIRDGANILVSVTLSDGAETVEMPAEYVRKRKIEVIGDSSACGYGVLGKNSTCKASAETLDGTSSYAEFVAEAFDAELNLQCWSGIGVFMNNGADGPSEKPMPYVYKYTTSENNTQLWDMNRYHPDAIVIIIGSNDYKKVNARYPTDEEFIGAWTTFVKSLIEAHPDTHVFASTMSDVEIAHTNVKKACESLGDKCTHFPMTRWSKDEDKGCSNHPNVKYEHVMADAVVAVVSKTLGWEAA